jgi:hypothetical protein
MTVLGPYRDALRKLASLSVTDWVRFAKAQAALLRARAEVRRRPEGELVSAVNGPASPVTAESLRQRDAERIGVAVNRAANYGLFRPTCLVRAIAIGSMLRQEGITGGRIRVGVGLRDGAFVAHAWVEYGGAVIGDDDAVVRRFETIDDLNVVAGH